MSRGFDNDQIKAIESNDLNQIILAVAGSGKTTTTIACVFRALNHPAITPQLSKEALMQPIDPRLIRVASFTNVAAKTFRDRLDAKSDGDTSEVRVSTLDKFGIEIINHIYKNAKFDQNIDTVARVLYYELNKKTNLQKSYSKYSDYISMINKCKNSFSKSDKQILKNIYDDKLKHYLRYLIETKSENDTFTVPIQIIYPLAIMTMLKHQFTPKIKLFIVDEIQDTSDDQFHFISYLRTQNPDMRFIGVGDISQSMYRWNKAQPKRVSNFINDFNASIYNLPNNYRSHEDIIDYANSMLENNLDNISGIKIIPKSNKKFKHHIDNRVNYIQSVYKMLEDIHDKIENYGVKPSDIAIISKRVSPLMKLVDVLETDHDMNQNFDIPFDISQQNRRKEMEFYEYITGLLSTHYAKLRDNSDYGLDQLDELFGKLIKFKSIYNQLKQSQNHYIDLLLKDHNRKQFQKELMNELDTLREKIEFKMTMLLFNPREKSNSNEVCISTVHGVKGEEYRYVYYIPDNLRPSKSVNPDENLTLAEREQYWGEYSETQNIHYVAITRAIEQFNIVDYFHNFHEYIETINDLKAKDEDYNIDVQTLLSPFKKQIMTTQYSDEEERMYLRLTVRKDKNGRR